MRPLLLALALAGCAQPAPPPPAARVTYDLAQADGPTLLQVVAAQARVRIHIAPGVEGRVDVALHDVPAREALLDIAHRLGARVVERDGLVEVLPIIEQVRVDRFDVDVEDVDLADVMERIGRQVGRNILVDPSVQERVTVSLRDIPWREAVDVIARMTRCEVEERPGGVLVLAQPPRVTAWDLQGASARTVLELFAAYGSHTVIGPPDLGTVQGLDDVRELRWDQAVTLVAADVGCEVEIDDGVVRLYRR